MPTTNQKSDQTSMGHGAMRFQIRRRMVLLTRMIISINITHNRSHEIISTPPSFQREIRRCFDVAIDHGFFNEHSFLSGIENLEKAVETLVAAAPDAIQLTVGQAPILQSLPGREKPSLVLRTDVANVYGRELPSHLFSRMIENPSSRLCDSTPPAWW